MIYHYIKNILFAIGREDDGTLYAFALNYPIYGQGVDYKDLKEDIIEDMLVYAANTPDFPVSLNKEKNNGVLY
jgi:hypothetical protein